MFSAEDSTRSGLKTTGGVPIFRNSLPKKLSFPPPQLYTFRKGFHPKMMEEPGFCLIYGSILFVLNLESPVIFMSFDASLYSPSASTRVVLHETDRTASSKIKGNMCLQPFIQVSNYTKL